jgi:hypothetical protein
LVHRANVIELMRRNGLATLNGRVVTEEGGPHPLGTVLDASGNPIPDPSAKETP